MPARSVVLALAAAMVVACSSPPEKERHQAEGALAAARAAGAAVYAPEQLVEAEAALDRYDAAVAQGDYRQALRLALEARDGAYDAARQSGDERVLARRMADQLVGEASARLIDLQQRRHRLPAAEIQSARAARLRSLLDVGTTRVQEARADLARRDYQAVGKTLEPFLQELREEFGPLPAEP